LRPRVFLWSITVILTAACAIQEPPPGGALDTKPATVVATFPADSAAGVSADTEIMVEFDEGMTRSRLERLVTFYPALTIGKVRWKKNTMVMAPEEPLHADTTYVVEIKPGFADAHGVKSPETIRFAFATSTKIDSGALSGHVFFRRKPSERAVVRLFRLPRDTSFSPEAVRPDRQVAANREGLYRFEFLPTTNTNLYIWAFQDENDNGSFDRDREAAGQLADSVVTLTAEAPQLADRDVYIVDPREPAEITGRIINAAGIDTLPLTVTMHALSDTTPPTYYTRCDSSGNFRLDQVLKGDYTLWAFLDLRPDSLCGSYPCPGDSSLSCAEICAQYPDTLVIEPGQKIKLEDLHLEAAKSREE